MIFCPQNDETTSLKDRIIMRLTCHYGIHAWTLFRMANSFIEAFPGDMAINRRCDRCGRMECTDDGKNWNHRL